MRHLAFAFALALTAAPTLSFAHPTTPATVAVTSSAVLAQAPGEPVEPVATPEPPKADTPAAEPVAAPAMPADPTPQDLIVGLGAVIDNWQNIGWVAGVIALITLLLGILRFKPIDEWLTSLDFKWIKPLIATVLGAALGGFSVFSTGAGVLNSIVAGILAGLGSVGFHELMDKLRKRTTKKTE